MEDEFIVLRSFLRQQVVPPFSGARYFGESVKVPKSNHFDIAKPANRDAFQHRLLLQFIGEFLQSAVGKGRVELPAQAPLREDELIVEKIVNFDAQWERIKEALSLYEKRIPSEERYNRELMVDLIRRHLSDEFGSAWKMHFLVASWRGRCVGMLICYEDVETNFAFVAYLAAAKNLRLPGKKNPRKVSERLAIDLMKARRDLGLERPPRFLFEVDDPALTDDPKERIERLSRLKLFDEFAPAKSMHLRALDFSYLQPELEWPPTGKRRLLLCYAAPGLHTMLPKAEVVDILTWTYTQLYSGDSVFEEPSARAAYERDTRELLESSRPGLARASPLAAILRNQGTVRRACVPSML